MVDYIEDEPGSGRQDQDNQENQGSEPTQPRRDQEQAGTPPASVDGTGGTATAIAAGGYHSCTIQSGPLRARRRREILSPTQGESPQKRQGGASEVTAPPAPLRRLLATEGLGLRLVR